MNMFYETTSGPSSLVTSSNGMKLAFTAIILIYLFAGCHEPLPAQKEFPIFVCSNPVSIDQTGATFRCQTIVAGQLPTSQYGFTWSIDDDFSPESSTSDTLGKNIPNGFFEKRIDYALAGNASYYVKAFAVLPNKRIIYSNVVTFNSQGSTYSPWTFETNSFMDGYDQMFAFSDNAYGYLLFQSGDVYRFNPAEHKITRGPRFPVPGNTGSQFAFAKLGNQCYVLSDIDRSLYLFDNQTWTNLGRLPFSYDYYSVVLLAHAFNNKLYFISSQYAYAYRIETRQWQQIQNFPEAIAGSISLNGKGYVITTSKSFWEYDFETGSAIMKGKYPGTSANKIKGFTDGNRLYFGLNLNSREMWSFDPAQNNWKKFDDAPVAASFRTVGFYLKDKYYVSNLVAGSNTFYELFSFDSSKQK
jgi:hypothetical protein